MFSEQSHDLRTFRGRIDRNCGTYTQDNNITRALAKLYDEVICTDQVIWCSLVELQACPLEDTCFIHTIEADDRDIVAILDGFVWESGILERKIVPPKEREEMWNSCCCFLDADSRQQALDRKVEQYIKKHRPHEPWSNVLASDLNCRMPTILLIWPFQYSQIMEVQIVDRKGES